MSRGTHNGYNKNFSDVVFSNRSSKQAVQSYYTVCQLLQSVDQLSGVVALFSNIPCTGPLFGLGLYHAVVLCSVMSVYYQVFIVTILYTMWRLSL